MKKAPSDGALIQPLQLTAIPKHAKIVTESVL
jgi:hypothetical protein